jgi:RNA polymerase sigma factor (sigma-70 family)
MRPPTGRSDEDLLVSGESEDFGVFYDRHVRSLLAYFARRTGDPEVAADLTAETFASAIVAQRGYRPTGPAVAWLYTIAYRRLADYHRRGYVERRKRRLLAMERRPLEVDDAAMISLLAADSAVAMLAELPCAQRDAVGGHVVEDRSYAELADQMQTSQAVVRQRVSRGLAALRRQIGGRR